LVDNHGKQLLNHYQKEKKVLDKSKSQIYINPKIAVPSSKSSTVKRYKRKRKQEN